MKRSWKTTTASLSGIVGLLGMAVQAQFDSDPATVAQWSIVIPAVIGCLSGLFSRDHDVTSEQAGAKNG